MKLGFNITEGELDQETKSVIKGKIVNILRNDEELKALIGQTVDKEVIRKVNALSSHITADYISRCFTTEIAKVVEEQATKEVNRIITALLSNMDTKVLKDLLREKTKFLKNENKLYDY